MVTIANAYNEWISAVLVGLIVLVGYVGILLVLIAVVYFPARIVGKLIARFRQSKRHHIDGDRGTFKDWLRLILTVGLTLVLASALYFLIQKTSARYSAVLFVGLPIVIALSVFLLPKSQSRYVTMGKIITVFLGLSFWFLGEGLICILMAAPLFYIAGSAAVASYEEVNRVATPAFIAILVIICLEGIHPALSFNREHSVSTQEIVPLSVAVVSKNLSGNPDFTELPLDIMLRLGFPVPVSATGTGLATGDIREFTFKRRDGELETVRFKVAFGDESHVQLVPIFDNTVISQWLRWQGTQIHWEAVTENSTKVSVNMQFERRLDPVWYFAPLQMWIVGKAADVLIDHAQTRPLL